MGYKIGDNGIFDVAALSIQYGDAGAVTLIDVIVFADSNGANDVALWAHELKHVEQFRSWKTRDFSIRYLRDHRGVEEPAYALQNQIAASPPLPVAIPQPQPFNPMLPPAVPVQAPPVMMGGFCSTPAGFCQMPGVFPMATPCHCQTMNGPIFGMVQ